MPIPCLTFLCDYVTMNWESAIGDFKNYLQLERAMAANTVEAYLNDVVKLYQFADPQHILPSDITPQHIQNFLAWINGFGLSPTSQARILSGIKTFYLFMSLEHGLLEPPLRLSRHPVWPGKYRTY